MASNAIMIGGAIINATAFVGGSYLAKFISGDSESASLEEKRDTTWQLKNIKKNSKNTKKIVQN